MKTKIYILIIFFSWVVTGCGNAKKDPFKEYQSINGAVRPYPLVNNMAKETRTQQYVLRSSSSLTFVQGESGEATFSVQLLFKNPEQVKYDLVMAEGPRDLGAQFAQTGKNTWSLRWKPDTKILNDVEQVREIPLTLEFVLKPESSSLSKRELEGVETRHDFIMLLQKNKGQPVIEDEFHFFPAATINYDQKLKIQFVVSVKGVLQPEELEVHKLSGPDSPSNELVQVDAIVGINSRPKRIKNLGRDEKGFTRFLYEVTFDARPFVDYVMEQISRNAGIKNKMKKGEITSAEALFYIEAINRNSSYPNSAEKAILFKVNLPMQTETSKQTVQPTQRGQP